MGQARRQVLGKAEIVVTKVPAPGQRSGQVPQSPAPALLSTARKASTATPAGSEAVSSPHQAGGKDRNWAEILAGHYVEIRSEGQPLRRVIRELRVNRLKYSQALRQTVWRIRKA